MTQQNQVAAQKSSDLKQFFEKPSVQAKIRELVNKNSASFATSVMQCVNSSNMLLDAAPISILNAACMAATLNLPINNSLGFAYIVPFRNNKTHEVEAQFQIGYKGFIQLAQRSGQFERMVSLPVYADQLIEEDPINGFKFDWRNKPAKKEQPIGYYAYFKLINGFTAELYMTRESVNDHAKKYSQSYRSGKGVWAENFEAMALKTVLKLLLSKQAPMSIEMQKGILSDSAVIKDITTEQYDYIENQPTDNAADLNDVIEAKPFSEEAAYNVDPETGEVLDTGAISDTDTEGLLL